MSRLTNLSVAVFAAAFLLTSVVELREPEACGVKLVVKANKKPRKKLAAKARKRVIASSGTRLAKRTPVNRKTNDRVRVATGAGTAQARAGSPQPRSDKTRTRTIGAAQEPVATSTPAPEPAKVEKRTRVATAETEPTREKPEAKRRPTPKPAAATATVLAEVYFDYNSDELNAEASDSLAEVIDWLRANPSGQLTLFGYTDPAGSPQYNQRLSNRRALAVRRFIADKAEVSPRRLSVKARGERELAYPEDSPKNRRVVVKSR